MLDEKALYAAATAALNARRKANGWPATTLDKMLTPDRDAWIEDVQAAITAYLKALSPGSTGEAEGWRDIKSAPLNQSVQIFIPGSDYYGNRGVYAGILVDMGSGRRWMTFGWAVGRDLGPEMQPTMWRPFEPPSALLSAAGER